MSSARSSTSHSQLHRRWAGAFFQVAQGTRRGVIRSHRRLPAGFARNKRAVADELGHKAGGRAVVQGIGIVPLVQVALVHHADPVANGKGLKAGRG